MGWNQSAGQILYLKKELHERWEDDMNAIEDPEFQYCDGPVQPLPFLHRYF
jgi:hypothetical protein